MEEQNTVEERVYEIKLGRTVMINGIPFLVDRLQRTRMTVKPVCGFTFAPHIEPNVWQFDSRQVDVTNTLLEHLLSKWETRIEMFRENLEKAIKTDDCDEKQWYLMELAEILKMQTGHIDRGKAPEDVANEDKSD